MKLDRCAECSLYEHEHPDHVFVAMEWPDWCKCEPADWAYLPQRSACAKFRQMETEPICKTCEHDEACHK